MIYAIANLRGWRAFIVKLFSICAVVLLFTILFMRAMRASERPDYNINSSSLLLINYVVIKRLRKMIAINYDIVKNIRNRVVNFASEHRHRNKGEWNAPQLICMRNCCIKGILIKADTIISDRFWTARLEQISRHVPFPSSATLRLSIKKCVS